MTNTKRPFSFEEIYEQNKRRIHYHIHQMNIRDPHQDYFQEGLFALWNAYEKYDCNKGPMSTYFNYSIRNRLIDKIRKETRINHNEAEVIKENKTKWDEGNRRKQNGTTYQLMSWEDPPITDPSFWQEVRIKLTEKQWKWVYFYIILQMPLKEIAKQENTTVEAVKSWGKQAKKKLRELI